MTRADYLTSKPHYAILDGLRGVAAVMVVIFHLCETFAADRFGYVLNHGYLAVDFFFILSGFVIGYAYDDRWRQMGWRNFVKRRLIRLQPMVVMGMTIGAVCFYFGESGAFPPIAQTTVWKMLLLYVLGCLMIPVPPSLDIRGWTETYPLNGPAWSLMFEYIANILYMIVLRRLPTLLLGVCVGLAAAATVYLGVTGPNGDFIGGWSLTGHELYVGFVRLAYPFLAGLLMARLGRLIRVRAAFWVCSLCLAAIFLSPRLGGAVWINGLYEAFCIIALFPLIVAMGAGGEVTGSFSTGACKFLGDISYPLYITHYPLIYIYTGWAVDAQPSSAAAFAYGALLLAGSIGVAWLCVRFYDLPVRAWLTQRFLKKRPSK